MYELSVESEFCAAHALLIMGVREPVHGHNFRVTLTLEAPSLDADALAVDFHEIERALEGVIAPWRNTDLHDAPQFRSTNPSAEAIARAIAAGVDERLAAAGVVGPHHPGVRILSVRVTEAPGCAAVYRPE